MLIETLEDLFVDVLSDMYNAEKQLTSALPKMAEKAKNHLLKSAFQNHLTETEGQVQKIEKIFELIDMDIKREKCEAMEGLVKEAEQMIKHIKDPYLLDVALIVAAQKVEHYEIASYGSLRALAELLNYDEAIPLIEEILDQEKAADEKLNEIALEAVNEKAIEELAAA